MGRAEEVRLRDQERNAREGTLRKTAAYLRCRLRWERLEHGIQLGVYFRRRLQGEAGQVRTGYRWNKVMSTIPHNDIAPSRCLWRSMQRASTLCLVSYDDLGHG